MLITYTKKLLTGLAVVALASITGNVLASGGSSGEDPLGVCTSPGPDDDFEIVKIKPSFSGSAMLVYGENESFAEGTLLSGGMTQPGNSGCTLVINPNTASYIGNSREDFLALTAEDIDGYCFSDAVASNQIGCDGSGGGIVIAVRNFKRFSTPDDAQTDPAKKVWYQMDLTIQQLKKVTLTPSP